MKRFMESGLTLQQLDDLKDENRRLQLELAKEQSEKASAISKGGEYKTALDIMLATMEAQTVSDQDFGGKRSANKGLMGGKSMFQR
jgi:hypothetical protein